MQNFEGNIPPERLLHIDLYSVGMIPTSVVIVPTNIGYNKYHWCGKIISYVTVCLYLLAC